MSQIELGAHTWKRCALEAVTDEYQGLKTDGRWWQSEQGDTRSHQIQMTETIWYVLLSEFTIDRQVGQIEELQVIETVGPLGNWTRDKVQGKIELSQVVQLSNALGNGSDQYVLGQVQLVEGGGIANVTRNFTVDSVTVQHQSLQAVQ